MKVVKTDAEISCAIDELERRAASEEGISDLLAGHDIQIFAEELMAERMRALLASHFGDWTISELLRLQGKVTERQADRKRMECSHPTKCVGLTTDGRRKCFDCGAVGARISLTESH